MKTLLITSLILIFSFATFAQDTLFKRNGEVILGKVTEINKTDIKYKKNNNPDGPTYSIGIDDVTMIEYKNGSKDVFQSPNISVGKTDDVYASGTPPQTQVNNNYYGTPMPRPGVNVVLGMGVPYWGPGWGWYRPFPKPYYHYGYGGYGYHHYRHGWRRH
ncbi:MAG: hypothetical protein ACXVC6_00950 [Bacteroidia bacterium]